MVLPPKQRSKRGVYNKIKPVYGMGINDADYVTQKYEYIDGKRVRVWICPIYDTWLGVLERCYSDKFHERSPTYQDCSMCDEWLIFSNFKRWMEQQDWEGKQLDKDLLVEGNKIYSPETCIFVHYKVNTFIVDNRASRGKYMIGVSYHKQARKFVANCRNIFTNQLDYLGLFTTELQAHLAWKTRKHELACQLADSEYVTDERLANALRVRYLNDFTSK